MCGPGLGHLRKRRVSLDNAFGLSRGTQSWQLNLLPENWRINLHGVLRRHYALGKHLLDAANGLPRALFVFD